MALDSIPVVTETSIGHLPRRQGKVRDIYEMGDEILLVATDRISAYDVVLPTPIPRKGALLTRVSEYWFSFFKDVKHHLIEVIHDTVPTGLESYVDVLRDRTMRCRKTEVVPIECVVRGYITGSGWKDYQRTGSVCGIQLPTGLQQCQQLSEPLFTPATKAETGHDENISFDEACDRVGDATMKELRDKSLDLYVRGAEFARSKGIIIADTKFEWGRRDGELILIDEVLTPDSSRFWPADKYEVGRDQESFDKQYVRNYLTTLVEAGRWDKTPPGPSLPDDIVANTVRKYEEVIERLTS